jgi:glucokinase
MNPPVIAIDLGGTTIKAAIVRGAEILASASIPARSPEGLAPQLPRLADLVGNLCASLGLTPSDCAGLGMAVPFLVDLTACRITSAPKEKYFDACDIDLPAWCRATFGLELRIENDAHAACLGEWRYGAGRGVDDLVMFTLGTGIGCSAILRGRPLRGKRFQAGVLCGHMISNPDGQPCACCPGNGCFESLSASRSLSGHAQRHPDFRRSPLAALAEIDFKAVFVHAAHGDAVATAVRNTVIRYWSALAINVCAAYDPDLIVIGGAVAAAADTFLPPMREYVNRHAWTVRPPDITSASLGKHAGTIGIASLFTHKTLCL